MTIPCGVKSRRVTRPKIVATFVCASSHRQRTHSAWTNRGLWHAVRHGLHSAARTNWISCNFVSMRSCSVFKKITKTRKNPLPLLLFHMLSFGTADKTHTTIDPSGLRALTRNILIPTCITLSLKGVIVRFSKLCIGF